MVFISYFGSLVSLGGRVEEGDNNHTEPNKKINHFAIRQTLLKRTPSREIANNSEMKADEARHEA